MVLIGRILRSNARHKFREIAPHQHDIWVRGIMPHEYKPYKVEAAQMHFIMASIII